MPDPRVNIAPLNYLATCKASVDPMSNFRRSAEWVPITEAGIASSCPRANELVVYPRNAGLLPNYAGHVPGNRFRIGETFGNATVNAKRWIALHKD